uniref:Sulfotransferase domain-containing protein n=1 Tax=viral metagenome TaxID=1070528 RepID=A0A6C0LJ38_9ZZZZ
MPYFKNDTINLLFIHIPKTGGSSVEFYFSNKFDVPLNNNSLYLFIDDEIKLTKNILVTSSLQHLTYNQMIQNNHLFNIDFNDIKIITIVRNPYKRIISDLFYLEKINSTTSSEEAFDIINDYLVSDDVDNHNIPQYKFIIDENNKIISNISILKTETLTNNMNDLGYADFDRHDNVNINKVNYFDYLNNKSIEVINDFYHLDFVFFNYNKI